MSTNLSIDPKLLQKALEVSGLRTKKDTVNLALKELINRHKQLEIIDLFGTLIIQNRLKLLDIVFCIYYEVIDYYILFQKHLVIGLNHLEVQNNNP